MVRYCSVHKCLESTKTNKNRRFFCFPADEQRCKQWIKAIGRMDLQSKSVNTLNKSYFVCELHFAASDCYKKFLKRFAVPSLFLPQLEDLSGTSKYTQTDVKLCSCKSQILAEDLSASQPQSTQTTDFGSKCIHQKRKWQLELKTIGKKQRLLESITENVTNARELHMSPLLKEIIEAHKVLQHNTQGNRYNPEYLMYALNLYFASPVDYQFISKILSLPNIRTLKRHIAFNISTKFDGIIIKCLQSKSRNLYESERFCVICADEILLKRHLHYQIDKDKVVGFHEINENQEKEIATRVFVVMAHGIFSSWKQPLGFCFLSQNKNYPELWLENIIAKMIEIGYNVCAFVSNFINDNQGSNVINIAKNKSISPDQPFFFVNGRKIYYIFNVPHLIINLRNNLINYDFVYNDDEGSEQVASWVDIEKMYNIEKDNHFKMTYKVTESHIRPNESEKKCVKYAAQVLSRTVAVTICMLIESGKLHDKCIGTSKFIKLINDTFDILNSSTVSNDYTLKKAFNHAEYQINTLEKAQHILSGLRVINRNNGKLVTNTMKFIKGFLTSIKAISSLATDLNTAGYNNLFTRRLNQDPLENFFGKVRQQGGSCCDPTAIQFLSPFKKSFMVHIIRHSEYTDCADDLDQLLMSVEETQNIFKSEENVPLESLNRTLKVGTSDYRLKFPKENAFTNICGYLLNKCYDHHKDCEIMKNYIISNEQYRSEDPFGTLINPPESFKQYIKQINSICEDYLKNHDFYHVGSEIITKLSANVFNLPCPCFPLEYLKKLFVRFRIFNVMRHNNKNFRDRSNKTFIFRVSHL